MANWNKNPFEAAGNLFAGAAKAAADTAGKATNEVGKVASGAAEVVANAAGKMANEAGKAAETADGVIKSAKEAAKAAVDAMPVTAGGIASGIASAAGTVGSVASGALNGAKASIDDKAAERLLAEEAEYFPKLKSAVEKMDETGAGRLLLLFDDSPLPLTEANARKIKATFPIPREQTVVWASAEFDLRPSGIAMTDRGVYIKTDVSAFKMPGKEQQESRLFYFEWEYFEPTLFAGDGDDNLALAVDEGCRRPFIDCCRKFEKSAIARNPVEVPRAFETGAESGNADAAMVAAAAALNSNAEVFVEQRAAVNNPAGHGELAEEANNIVDRLQGYQARILGRDNAKNGPDRMVDGVLVQTKYYKSAKGSLEACFDPSNHQYRYLASDGSPMQLEVPKDQYQQVLHGFEEKIKQGKVPGVSDPGEARNIVREGKLTYEQAVNLTKPGTIESIAYDASTGIVTCSCAFGLSFLASSFAAYRETKDVGDSVKAGVAAGVQVFGLSFAQHMIVSQLSRTGMSNMLMAPSRAVVGKLGFRTSATVVNGLRALTGKTAISGAAASKQLAKMLRGNTVSAVATLAVFSVPETYKLLQGKASGAQYAQNIASLATSVVGGIAGSVAAGAAAAKVGAVAGTAVTPGVGTVVGLAGGMVGGTVGTLTAGAVGGVLFEGDATSFGRYFNAMVSCIAVEYMLSGAEMDQLLEDLNAVEKSEFKSLLEDTLSSEKQEESVRSFLVPKFEKIILSRESYSLPTDDQIVDALIEIEEETRQMP